MGCEFPGHFFCLMTQVSICLHVCHWTKTLVFLRFRLPVLLQQNLRCKVWDDTAKIRYICMYILHSLPSVNNAVKEIVWTLTLTAFHSSAHS